MATPDDVSFQIADSGRRQGAVDLQRCSETPWTLIKADDKLRSRLETMRTVLDSLDYPDRNAEVVHPPDPWIVAPAATVYP